MNGSNASFNKAHYGGAIYISDLSNIFCTGTNTVENNEAEVVGGAFAILNSYLDIILNNEEYLQINSNQADRGSGVYLYQSTFNAISNVSQIIIMKNIAKIGGTFFWIHDDIMMKQPDMKKIKFSNNTALYGERGATQATSLKGPILYELTSFDGSLSNPLQFIATDFYGNSLVDFPEGAYIFIATISTNNYYCLGRTPSINRYCMDDNILFTSVLNIYIFTLYIFF